MRSHYSFLLLIGIFLAVWSWVTYALGTITLSLPITFFLALGMTALFFKFVPMVKLDSIPKIAFPLLALVLLQMMIPLIFLHPFYDASTDALHTMNVRVLALQDKIPPTYAPYSEMPLLYPLGFHLIAVHITRIVSFVPDYLVLWGMGLGFIALFFMLLVLIFRKLGLSENHSVLAATALCSSISIQFYFFTGLYPVLFAIDIILIGLLFLIEQNLGAWVFFPIAILIHPAIGLIGYALAITWVITQGKWKQMIIPFAGSMLLTFPAWSLYELFLRFHAVKEWAAVQHVDLGIIWFWIVQLFSAMLTFLGPVLSVLFFTVIVMHFIFPARASQNMQSAFRQWMGLNLFVVGALILFLQFFSISWLGDAGAYNKLGFWVTLSVIGIIAASSSFQFIAKFKSPVIVLIGIGIIVSSFLLFYSSPDFHIYASGEKTRVEAVQFASAFHAFDPRVRTVAYFSSSPAKISQYADKASYDPTVDYFVSPYGLKDERTQKWVQQRQWELKEWIQNKCVECALNKVDYVVVNRVEYPFDSPLIPVFQFGNYQVYARKSS